VLPLQILLLLLLLLLGRWGRAGLQDLEEQLHADGVGEVLRIGLAEVADKRQGLVRGEVDAGAGQSGLSGAIARSTRSE
jgi:hypothetical protein